MRLVIASNNSHKVREIKQIMGTRFPEIYSQREAGVELDPEEIGSTFSQNAILKAEQVLFAAPGFDAAIADDSGLVVDALNGAPGVFSARFAGEGHDDKANNRKLLELMEPVEEPRRSCRFVSAVALAQRGRPTLCVTGSVEGMLLREPRGDEGFGYDPLFYYAPFDKTFAQASAEEKNQVSHRKCALNALEKELAKDD